MHRKNLAVTNLKAGPDDGLEEGTFTAYASTFDRVPDSYGDVIAKGAFQKSLAKWAEKGDPIPILWGHDLHDPFSNIGSVEHAEEDDRGLKIAGQLDLSNPKAEQVYKLLKGRRVNQMSFAFRDVKSGTVKLPNGKTANELRDLDVYEVSIVPLGANSNTEIVSVKEQNMTTTNNDEHQDTWQERAQKSAELIDDLSMGGAMQNDDDPVDWGGGGTKAGNVSWAKSVSEKLARAAQGYGVKALLTGQVTTPPAVEVTSIPDAPTRLLDLIPREQLAEHTFSYLRQVTKTNNAAVVADNALKPTSVYTWQEVTDRARVIAHLSEPFPLRYLSDHASVMQVLEAQMQTGVIRELERQVIEGDGAGENFTGILATTGVNQVPFTTDPLVTVRTALTTMAGLDEQPTGWVVHPSDAQKFDLMRENGTTGAFLLQNPERFFVGPVVLSTAIPAGQAILADWRQAAIKVREREHVLAATQAGDLFDKNQVKLRAEGRYGFTIKRPQAFAVVALTA